jgi:hypothetical protein
MAVNRIFAQENLFISFMSASHDAVMIRRAKVAPEEHWGTEHGLLPKARIEA